MSIRNCIEHTFYCLTELILPETFDTINVWVTKVNSDFYFYITEIIAGIKHYAVRFYARRNDIGEVIGIIPHSVEISQ